MILWMLIGLDIKIYESTGGVKFDVSIPDLDMPTTSIVRVGENKYACNIATHALIDVL